MIPTGDSIVGNTRRRVLRPDEQRHHLFPPPTLITRILVRTSPPLHDFPTAHVKKSVAFQSCRVLLLITVQAAS